jgi:hypothetical protein
VSAQVEVEVEVEVDADVLLPGAISIAMDNLTSLRRTTDNQQHEWCVVEVHFGGHHQNTTYAFIVVPTRWSKK